MSQTHEHAEQHDPMSEFLQEDGTFKVEGDMLVSEVIAAFPKAAAVLMGYGLHCVGCAANAFDTIEGGAKLHGMDDAEIARMVADVNVAINKRIETIEVTERAARKVKELRSQELASLRKAVADKREQGGEATDEEKERLAIENWPLRIAVIPGGCAGFSYDMDFDTKEREDDTVLSFFGLTVLIDKDSFESMRGASIDYVESLMGSGFKIDNPNAKRGCGCGKSFG